MAGAGFDKTPCLRCRYDFARWDGHDSSLRSLRRANLNSKVPILMTSASRFKDSELGSPVSVSWLYKPFELDELANQIKRVFEEVQSSIKQSSD
jgi:DNA-binding response OmpR family regulator